MSFVEVVEHTEPLRPRGLKMMQYDFGCHCDMLVGSGGGGVRLSRLRTTDNRVNLDDSFPEAMRK